MNQILEVVKQILIALYHFCQTESGQAIVASLAAALVVWINNKFHLSPQRQSEVGHAVNYAVKCLQSGKFDTQGAINTILATGKVPESKATTIVTALVNNEVATVSPTKGVIVNISPEGGVSVDPSGLGAKLTYKASKWLKKRIKKL
jgi:hypothetical protein